LDYFSVPKVGWWATSELPKSKLLEFWEVGPNYSWCQEKFAQLPKALNLVILGSPNSTSPKSIFWVFVGCGQATFDIDNSLALPQKHRRKQRQ
jgi:hypothetical protein